MIIPKYWAEARLHQRDRKRQVTVRRFGWSDISEADAQAHADARVREAFDRVVAGEALPRRERRVAYNGAEGVPIREEIVDHHGDAVITRNGYGALCLNTPNVLFADIDFSDRPARMGVRAGRVFMMLAIMGMVFRMQDPSPSKYAVMVIAGIVGGFLFGGFAAQWVNRLWIHMTGGYERHARQRVADYLAKNPDWRVRLYRTPAGLRLLALHRLFDPREPEVQACFDALRVDPLYGRMCFNQNCFRARVSPKPWRMGLSRLRSPYSAVWRPEHADLAARRQWVECYEHAAERYASCRFIETLGGGRIDAEAEALQQLHDALCRVDQDLTIA